MIKRKNSVLICVIFLFQCNIGLCQVHSDFIFGKWTLVNSISDANSKKNIIGSTKIENELTIAFYKDGNGYDFSNDNKFQYQVDESNITIGNREYNLIRLTKDTLIIKELKNSLSISLSTLTFKKIED